MTLLTLSHDAPLLETRMQEIATEIDRAFDRLLPVPGDGRDRLYRAMRHAAIGGGKRLRPLLVAASAELFHVPASRALRAGLAVECVHVHSLIHDDLPCMDDDDLRRGRPTVHRAFDEATAVLAGDALHALAFELLADPETHEDPAVRSGLITGLARAAGADGMAGGQMLDLQTEWAAESVEAVARLQRLKTGALIGWSVEAGAMLGGASTAARKRLGAYARCLGLAFQIADDLLDLHGDEACTGKRLRKDAAAGKATFASLLGAGPARQYAEMLTNQAVEHIAEFGTAAELLRRIARFAVERDR
jgi:farnesyl diphosphate synthase